jgi:uncharacterized protein YprB with RNaseH-like and TPR domain
MVIIFDIETTGLDPQNNIVILIGMKRKNKIKQWKLWKIKDEAKMILEAIEEIEKVDQNETIVGYNNLKFDVPFMLRRLEILKKMKPEFWKKIHDKKWFDLYQYLGDDYRSLKFWSLKAGIKRSFPELSGKHVPTFYKNKEFKKIEQHNKDDLETSERLFEFLKEKNPEFIPFK